VPYLYSNGVNAAGSTNATQLPGGSKIRPTYGNSRDNWYGLNNRDYEKEKSDLFTASVTHKFTDTNKIRNSLRYSKTKQDYIWTQPDDSKGNALNGYVWRRGNYRVYDTTTLQNVTEFTGKEQTGSIGHSYAFGLELSKEKPMAAPAPSRAAPVHLGVRPWCTT
jgi:catecholate siderophore receptor